MMQHYLCNTCLYLYSCIHRFERIVKNTIKNIFTLFVLSCTYSISLLGQCSISNTIAIIDNDTISNQIVVSGASNNDLSNLDQCVAQIDIQFRHQFVGDVNVYLTSPAGQSVRLIGRAIEVSATTDFINWDVSFVPCDSTTNPPSGISGVWDNQSNWAIFTDYEGSFHPNDGCLEDFNTGAVNGGWIITVEDISDFGTGIISGFSITFCDSTSIECQSCDVALTSIDQNAQTLCAGSLDPLELLPAFPVDYVPDSIANFYGYTIFSMGEILRYDSTLFVDDLNVGTYQICPITYNRKFQSEIPIPGSIHTNNSLEQLLISNDVCGIASTQCMQLEILDAPDIIRTSFEACLGDTIRYENQTYTESVQDTIYSAGPACDTVEVLSIEFINPLAQILPVDPLINCMDSEIYLFADTNGLGNQALLTWETVNGSILQDLGDSILVDASGIYTLIIDDRTCRDSASIEVLADIAEPIVDLTFDTLNCSIDTIQAFGSSSSIITSYTWQLPNSMEQTVDTLKSDLAGLYTVTAIAANGCTSVLSFEIVLDTALLIPQVGDTAITCLEEVVSIRPTQGINPSYDYEWRDVNGLVSNNEELLNIFTPGTYQLHFEGPNTCKDSLQIDVIDEREYPSLNFTLPTINCEDGPFTANVTSNLILQDVIWTHVASQTIYTGEMVDILDPGAYLIRATSDLGCIKDTLVEVLSDTTTQRFDLSAGVLDCANDSVQLSTVQDISGFIFEWTGPGNFSSLDLSPFVSVNGNYTLEVTFSNGCTSISNVEVLKADDKPDVDFIISPVTCLRDTATISVSDKSFDYTWTDNLLGINVDSFRTITPGIIEVTITDPITSCEDIQRLVIEDFSTGPEIDFEGGTLTCTDDTIQIIGLSTDILSAIEWEGVVLGSQNQLSPLVDEPGIKRVQITDQYGCVLVDSVEVLQDIRSPIPTIDMTFFSCNEDEIPLSFTSDLPIDSVFWSGPGLTSNEVTPNITIAGTYNLQVFGENGCEGSDMIVVEFDTIQPAIQLLNVDTISCLRRTIELALGSGDLASVRWEDDQGNVIGTEESVELDNPGFYTLIVEGQNACISDTTFEIVSDVVLPTISVDISPIDCNNNQATLIASSNISGVTFQWDPAGLDVQDSVFTTPLLGSYMLVSTTSDGCKDTTFHEVAENFDLPNTDVFFEDTLSCNKPEIFLAGLDESSDYEWLDQDGMVWLGDTVFVQRDGAYQVIVTGSNGCKDSTVLFVPIDTTLLDVNFDVDTLTCNVTDVIINVSSQNAIVAASWTGPLNYGSNDINPVVTNPGYYTIQAEGENGCVTTDSVFVVLNDFVPDFSIDYTFLPCTDIGTTLRITSQDNIEQCQWSGPNGFISNDPTPLVFEPGEYRASCITSTGCPGFDTLTLTYDTITPVFNAEADPFICGSTEVEVRALDTDDDLSIEWLGPQNYFSDQAISLVSQPGMYQLVVQGQNLCRDTLDVEVVDDRSGPEVSIQQLDSLLCDNTEVELVASSFDSLPGATFSYSWDGPNILLGASTPLALVGEAGEYMLTVSNARNNCQTVISYLLDESPIPSIDIETATIDPTCKGFANGALELTNVSGGVLPYDYSLNNGPFTTNPLFQFLQGGVVQTLVVRDANGCEREITIQLNEGSTPDIVLPPDTIVNLGEPLVIPITYLENEDFQDSIVWTSSYTLDCNYCLENTIVPTQNGFIEVTVFNENGCSDTEEMKVGVRRVTDFKLANVISTKGNVENSVFFVPKIPGVERVNFLKIYSRRGDLVHDQKDFSPGDPQFGWNGKFNGSNALSGVYAYIIELMYADGHKSIIHGDLTLIP